MIVLELNKLIYANANLHVIALTRLAPNHKTHLNNVSLLPSNCGNKPID